jgi:hypothetical protein
MSGEVKDLRNDIEEAFESIETPGHGGTGVLAVDEWVNPLAANATYVLGATVGTLAIKTVTTFLHATIPHARNLSIAMTAAGTFAGSPVVAVHGTDVNGDVLSENFVVANATVVGSKAFKTIISVVLPSVDGVIISALSITVGTGNKLGLGSKVKLRNTVSSVFMEMEDGQLIGGSVGSAATAVNNTVVATNQNSTPVITAAKIRMQQNLGALAAPGTNYVAQYAAGAALDDAVGPFTQMVPPRTVQIARGGAGAATVYTITGTDCDNAVLTETINSNGAVTVEGTRAFKTITRVQSNVDPTVTTDIKAGKGFGLGGAVSDVDAVGLNGVLEAPASYHAASGTVVPTTAPNGTRLFSVDYRVLPTATQAAHGHVQDTHNHTQVAHTHPGGGSLPGTYAVPAVGLPNGTYTPTDAPNGAHDYALVYERDLV